MGYCLLCGRLRDTRDGVCEQCRIDRNTAHLPAQKVERLRRLNAEGRHAHAREGRPRKDRAPL